MVLSSSLYIDKCKKEQNYCPFWYIYIMNFNLIPFKIISTKYKDFVMLFFRKKKIQVHLVSINKD